MGRPTKKNEEPTPTPQTDLTTQSAEPKSVKENVVSNKPTEETEVEKVNTKVLELMKLYPHYEELWITPSGFVHPKNAPKYCTKGATLFKNKFYKK